MSAAPFVLCARPDQLWPSVPLPGSALRPCSGCGARVVLAPATLRLGPVRPVCCDCYRPDRHGRRPTMTPDKARELTSWLAADPERN